MKSIRFLFIILFSVYSFSQSYKVKTEEMIELFNNDDTKYVDIANNLLDNTFGKIDNETKFFSNYVLAYHYISKEQYKKALEAFNDLIIFNEQNIISDTYSTKKKCLRNIKSTIKDLEIIIANLSSDENKIKSSEINNGYANKTRSIS